MADGAAGGGGEGGPKRRRVEDEATLAALRKEASEQHWAPAELPDECLHSSLSSPPTPAAAGSQWPAWPAPGRARAPKTTTTSETSLGAAGTTFRTTNYFQEQECVFGLA